MLGRRTEGLPPGFNPAESVDGVTRYESGSGEIALVAKRMLNAEDAEKNFASRAAFVRGLFDVYADPYFGTPDKDSECTSGFDLSGAPQETGDYKTLSFKMKATKNLVYGVCDSSQLAYWSELRFLYCKKNRQWNELKRYWPIGREPGWNWNLSEICDDGN